MSISDWNEKILIDWEFLDPGTLINEGYMAWEFTEKWVIYDSQLSAQIAVELCLNHNQAVANQQLRKN